MTELLSYEELLRKIEDERDLRKMAESMLEDHKTVHEHKFQG